MARRGGKAANRRARQQRRNRPAATPPAPTPAPVSEVAEQPMPAATAATPAAAVTPARPASPAPAPARIIAHGSALSAHAREEYHYVGRDLRNIGILVVIMFAVLAVATLAINVL